MTHWLHIPITVQLAPTVTVSVTVTVIGQLYDTVSYSLLSIHLMQAFRHCELQLALYTANASVLSL